MSQSLDKQMDTVVVPGLQFARKVYVLRKIDDEPGRQTFVGATGAAHALTEAQHFPSRLAARGYTMNQDKRGGFAAAEWEYVQIELVPDVPKIEKVEGLMYEDPIACINRVCELHAMYSDRVSAWVRHATNMLQDYTMPKVCVTVRPQLNWTGLYSPMDHTCHYVLPLAMLNLGRKPLSPIDYEETIAHEVVHAYQRHFVGQIITVGHGGDFYAMMRHAALYPTNTHTHAPLPGELTKCVTLFKTLQKPMEKMAEGGLLSSLPCEVTTAKIKRKGLR